MFNIAVFASGAGSNAQKLIDYFRTHHSIKIGLIVSNKSNAGVLQIAQSENIPALVLGKEKFFHGNGYVDELSDMDIGFIVLAGFLWKIPSTLIRSFPNKIVNIHPALLPNYGGKGMYGSFVHESVIKAGDTESGITIHFVDDQYDHGPIIFKARCSINKNDTAETLAQKIHQLEHKNYPRVVEEVVNRSRYEV